MATQTTNLGLTKPGYDEAADVVPAVNNNMDTLDAKIGAVPANSSVQGQLDSHSQAIGNLSNLTTTEKGSLVGAANELNSNLQKKIASISFTIPSTGNSETLTLPTGYTTSNCVPVAIEVTSDARYFNQYQYAFVYYAGTVAMLYYLDSERGRNCVIYFARTD